MSKFKIINNINEIPLNSDSPTFNSKGRFVDEKGHKIKSADYAGRQYKLIAKKERQFSDPELVGRRFLAVLAVVGSLGFALFSDSVWKLFKKQKEHIRFGLPVYIKPKLLLPATRLPGELNFALVEKSGKQTLLAVAEIPSTDPKIPSTDPKIPSKYCPTEKYCPFEGTALEALLKIAQKSQRVKPDISPISRILKHPDNSIISEEEFLEYILAKDETGTPRICTLNADSTLDVLNLIKEKKLPINLREQTSQNETLFTIWAAKGYCKITQLLLKLDPTVISQIRDLPDSAIFELLLRGDKREAELLLKTMEAAISLSGEELWINRALKNECAFPDQDFIALEDDLKAKIYLIAIAYQKTDFALRLQALGMDYKKPQIKQSIHTVVKTYSNRINFNLFKEFKKLDQESGKTVEQDKPPTFLQPKLLFGGTRMPDGLELNFALIETDGKQELVAVTSSRSENQFDLYEGSALEALLELAQDEKRSFGHSSGRHIESPISYLLNHPENSIISHKEFFEYILAKDENGTPRICTLNAQSTLDILQLAKEKNIPIDLHEKTPENETLFTLWAGKGYYKISQFMLDLDPSAIQQINELPYSLLVKSALCIDKRVAELLLESIEHAGMDLTTDDLWIKRALKNECSFSDQEFTELDDELKLKIFFVANVHHSMQLVSKLESLGMDEPPQFRPGPGFLADNMNVVTARAATEGFLKNLRTKGLLFTHDEFSQLDKSEYELKLDQIGRILGRDFVEKVARENGLQHIKVPQKIVVLNPGLQSISVKLSEEFGLILTKEQLKVYAKKIERVKRNLSLEEAIEFMIILEKTGFCDFIGGLNGSKSNFIFAEDGIYFIDTEFENFSPAQPKFHDIISIKNHLEEPEDVEKFMAEFRKRVEAFNASDVLEKQEEEYDKFFDKPYNNLAAGYSRTRFAFPLDSILN